MKKQLLINNLINKLSIVALIGAATHASADYSYVNVADTDPSAVTPVGPFVDFMPSSLSGGTVACTGSYSGGAARGIFTGNGGPLSVIAKTGDLGPIGTWTSSSFSLPPAISGGQVVFLGTGSGGQGVFSYNAGVFAIVAKTGDAGPLPVTAWTGFSFGALPAISEGRTTFVGGYSAGVGVFTRDVSVVPPSYTTIATTGGGPAAPVGTFTSFAPGGVAISGSTVAFIAAYNSGAGLGVFKGDGSAAPTPIAKRSDSSGTAIGTFSTFSPPAISGGTVAFGVLGSAGGQGIFKGDGSVPPTPIVTTGIPTLLTGIPTPVFVTFSSFLGSGAGAAISGDAVAFAGKYNSDTVQGIFIWSSSSGTLTPVVRTGDSLFGSTLASGASQFLAGSCKLRA